MTLLKTNHFLKPLVKYKFHGFNVIFCFIPIFITCIWMGVWSFE